nr:hypothetical protein [uncultured Hyphomonas sp.]
MRIERTGRVEPLTPRFERFVEERLSGVSLDSGDQEEALRPDWICADGAVAIEIKTLAEDGSERRENLQKVFESREDWPTFFGSVSSDNMFKHTSDPNGLQKLAIDRLGRPIKNHIRKANSQLGAYTRRSEGLNPLRLLVLINEDHEIYSPDLVCFIAAKELKRRREGTLARPHVDAVLYLSERHATVDKDQILFPILIVHGYGCGKDADKRALVNWTANQWADWQGAPPATGKASASDFSTIQNIPDEMPKSDFWRLQYRRSPYLSQLSDLQLRERFDEVILQYLLATNPTSPQPISERKPLFWIERFTHILEALNDRGLSMEQIDTNPERLTAAAKRNGSSNDVLVWLSKMQIAPGTSTQQ